MTSDARSAGDEAAASLPRQAEVGSAPTELDDEDEDEDDDNSKNIGSVVIPEQLKSYDQKNKKFLALLNSIGREMYENASEEVKKKVTEEIDERYRRKVEAYNQVKKPVSEYTPDDYVV